MLYSVDLPPALPGKDFKKTNSARHGNRRSFASNCPLEVHKQTSPTELGWPGSSGSLVTPSTALCSHTRNHRALLCSALASEECERLAERASDIIAARALPWRACSIYRWWLLLFGVCVCLFGLLFKGTRPTLERVRKSTLETVAS